jgi:two-component sensor histidine kinase
VGQRDEMRTYDMRISPIADWRGRLVSRVVVLRDITERKQAEEQIRASLKEKEVLLKEIHHRVKNNLQVISSLLYLQSKNVRDKETFGILQESHSRVRSMVLVHERLYQSPDLARVDFAEYVRSLANHLFRSYGINTNVIQLKINSDDVLLGVDTAIPCGLILNELVSNALKHAFPDGKEGEVRIELRADEGQLTLVVSDNGVGFPQDLDFRDTGSLGLQLVNTLVEQIEGTIELDRNDGTAFMITFTEPR